MGFSGNTSYVEGEPGNIFAHVLKAGAGQVKKIFLKHPFQRAVVRANTEVRKSVKIKRAFRDSPHDGETFKLNCGILLLGSRQSLRTAMNDLEVFGTGFVDIDMTQGITQAMETRGVCEQNNVFRRVKMANHKIAGKDLFQGVKLKLVLGQPQKRTPFARELSKSNNMVLVIGHKEC